MVGLVGCGLCSVSCGILGRFVVSSYKPQFEWEVVM